MEVISHHGGNFINTSYIISSPRRQNAIRSDGDKQSALEKMEELGVEMLPVVDFEEGFVGVVERSRLASSLIIEVANKVR